MLYLSSTCSSSKKFSTIVDELVALGVRHIELSGNIKCEDDLFDQAVALRDKFLLKYVLHNYFPPPQEDFVLNLASRNKKIIESTLKLVSSAALWMDKLNLDVFGIHGGHNVDMQPAMVNYHFIVDEKSLADKTQARKILYKNVKHVMDKIFIDPKRKFALENLTPKSKTENYALMAMPDEIEGFLEFSKPYKNLGFLLDLGHLCVAGHFLGFDSVDYARHLLKEYHDKIFQLHLSDNDGSFDFHYVHSKDSWQMKVLKEFYDFFEKKPITFEWDSRANNAQEISKGIQLLQKEFGKTILG